MQQLFVRIAYLSLISIFGAIETESGSAGVPGSKLIDSVLKLMTQRSTESSALSQGQLGNLETLSCTAGYRRIGGKKHPSAIWSQMILVRQTKTRMHKSARMNKTDVESRADKNITGIQIICMCMRS